MGNCHYQQPIRTRQIVFFPKLKANSSKARFTKSPKTRAPQKKKKKQRMEIFFLTAGSGVNCSIAKLRGILWGIDLSSRGLSGLVSSHFFINLLQEIGRAHV